MRLLFPFAILLAAQIGAAWAVGEINVARPGGAYSSIEAESAEACERLCADDGLCMAWSFRAGQCELKAIVPAAVAQSGTVSGVGHRAPASLHVWTPPPEAAPPPPEPAPGAEPEPEPVPEQADSSALLLGGLDEHEVLRSRLGN